MNPVATGQYIRRKRKELGLSQKQLAEKLFVEPQAISKWERGLSMPDLSNIEKLMEIFNCSYEDILNAKEEVNNEEPKEEIPNQEMYYPMVIDIVEENTDKKEKVKFFDFLSGKRIKKLIGKLFGVEYENVYTKGFLLSGLKKKRTKEDYEDTLTQGMYQDNPSHKKIGIEAPWLYGRVAIFLYICYIIALGVSRLLNTPTYAVIFTSIVGVIPLLVFLFESNFSRNVSIFNLIVIFCFGGISSILLTLILDIPFIAANDVLLTVLIAPITEEIAKAILVIICVCIFKPKNMLTGLLLGFTVGAGFAVFESLQYAINYYAFGILATGDLTQALELSLEVILTRTANSVFGSHHFYTAFFGCFYVMTKKNVNFKFRDLFNWKVLVALLFSISLHALWNGGATLNNLGGGIMMLLDLIICTGTMIVLINVGIAQTRFLDICEQAQCE